MKYVYLFLLPIFLWGNLDHATIAAYAVNTKTGTVVLQLDENRSMIPASCLKVVTTAAALHLLGPEFRFKTELVTQGEIKNGVLHGNVIIRGGGDPCLGSERVKSAIAWDRQIEKWKEAIDSQGIHEIRGKVIGDASLWEKAQAAPSWLWEDLGNYYGAGASALTFHENMYTLTFKPGKEVGAAAILDRVFPVMPQLCVHTEVVTGPVGSGDGTCIYGSEYNLEQVVRGTVPAGVEEFSIKGSVPDPAQFCSGLLKEALVKQGIKVGGEFLDGQEVVIQTTISPPVEEIIYWVNQVSHNLFAEHLLKAMGGGRTDQGIKAVHKLGKREGIDLQGMQMVDGSGLSRKNFMTPKQLTTILMKMQSSPHFTSFFASLPEKYPGVRAKDGLMSSTVSLAGYKGDVVFTIFINNGSSTKEMREKIAELLSKF